MRYIYGPIKSRRLGNSLGVSLTPYKICNFDCIYCQLGKTKHLTCERKEYVKTEEIIEEVRSWFNNYPDEAKSLNYVTISGFGEPTLNLNLAKIIQEIKRINPFPLALITNSSLLADSSVRKEVFDLDLIIPSLDTVDPYLFKKINRPHQDIQLEKIVKGLIDLKKETKVKVWLEVMLVKKVNDDLRQIKKLKKVIELIKPDKVQLNSPIRFTAEPGVLPVEKSKLEKIKEIFEGNCEIL